MARRTGRYRELQLREPDAGKSARGGKRTSNDTLRTANKFAKQCRFPTSSLVLSTSGNLSRGPPNVRRVEP